MKRKLGSSLKNLGIVFIGLVVINTLAALGYKRFDLTQNKHYSLSEPSKEIIQSVEKPIFVSVFLKGDFPSNFKRLQEETRYLLEEFKAQNSQIRFKFYDPLKEADGDAESVGQAFFEQEMPPQRLNVRKDGKDSQRLIFPWAVATYGQESVRIPLLKMNPEDDEDDLVRHSVQNLEYAFIDGFKQLVQPKSKKIAVMRSKGELPDANLAGFLRAAAKYYYTAPFSLDSVEVDPQGTLEELLTYDLILEAKPRKAFSEEEKLVLDQYMMHGGKAIWLVESVAAEKDSLFTENQSLLALPQDLNLSDFFFKYGIRIPPSLVNDLHADALILASGQGRQTQFQSYPWYYSPLVVPTSKHPIVNNIAPVRFDFANPIDTLRNPLKKTPLLQSSLATRVEGTPIALHLRELIEKEPDFTTYQHPKQNLAVLVEGYFTSVYKDRIKPFSWDKTLDQSSSEAQMLVVSDGDVIKNEIENGIPTSLEYHSKTGKAYGNQEFLINALNYMLDDSGLLTVRTKKVNIGFLDPEKIGAQKTFWQFIHLALPVVLSLVIGYLFARYRKAKYRSPL